MSSIQQKITRHTKKLEGMVHPKGEKSAETVPVKELMADIPKTLKQLFY